MSGQEWLLRRAFPLFASLLGAGYAAALSFAVFVGDSATAAQTPATTAVHFVCLAGAAGGSVVLALAQRQGLRWSALVTRLVLVEVFLTLSVPPLSVELCLIAPLVLEAADMGTTRLSALAVAVVVAVFLGLRWLNLGLVSGHGPSLSRSLAIADQSRQMLPAFGLLLTLVVLGVPALLSAFLSTKVGLLRSRQDILNRVVNQLSRTNLSFQELARDAGERSSEQERLRITRELHDVIGYTFASNIMMMEAAVSALAKDPARAERLIDQSRDNTVAGLDKVRAALYRLRADGEREQSLGTRIRQLTETFSLATNTTIELQFNNFPDCTDERLAESLYAFVQQAVTNAFLHGLASRVLVSLYSSTDSLFVSVRDNGRGSASVVEGIGLAGIRERLAPLGGSLRILNAAKGFDITCEVPRSPGRATL